MKATGIVRRIDELGRVVIPKEIRRVQHIRSGDSLEIFMEENGEVVFKKYSPLAELGEPAAVYADVLARRLVVCWSATGSISWRQPVRARMSCSTVSCRPSWTVF